MSRNNVKPLTIAELEKLNSKYRFDVEGNDILVMLNGYDRVTRHPKDKCFHINSRSYVKRKVCFCMDAITFWLKCRETTKYSLFDVQQAVNMLTITYQSITYDAVMKYLAKPSTKIQIK